jgi:hypothetical protein
VKRVVGVLPALEEDEEPVSSHRASCQGGLG